MPKAKRAPIDYKPQFGGEIFRPREVVESDLITLEKARSDEQEKERPLERSDHGSNERTISRSQVRHSFDVRQDQLLALADIQTQLFRATGRKPKLGELVQQALDTYIASNREQRIVRSDDGSNERNRRNYRQTEKGKIR